MIAAGDPTGLIADFVRASRLIAQGDAPAALRCLLPGGLAQEGQHHRVHVMVAVGALLTGTMTSGYRVGGAQPATGDPQVRVLAGQFVQAGAELDARGMGDLIAAHCWGTLGGVDELLIDVLVELTSRFATLEGSDR